MSAKYPKIFFQSYHSASVSSPARSYFPRSNHSGNGISRFVLSWFMVLLLLCLNFLTSVLSVGHLVVFRFSRRRGEDAHHRRVRCSHQKREHLEHLEHLTWLCHLAESDIPVLQAVEIVRPFLHHLPAVVDVFHSRVCPPERSFHLVTPFLMPVSGVLNRLRVSV